MFTLTRHRPETDKLLNTEHKQNPSIRSGPREGHSTNHVFVFRGALKTCKCFEVLSLLSSRPQYCPDGCACGERKAVRPGPCKPINRLSRPGP
jgi:hypothetical protein